jgi:hypothetical protein
LGNLMPSGTPFFFPATFLLKTPIPSILLFAVSLIALARNRIAHHHFEVSDLYFILPGLGFGLLLLNSKLNLGYRHLLPILPFLYLATGSLTKYIGVRSFRWGLIACMLSLVIANISIYPNYLAYFNLLAGGSAQGYRQLVDSNLDWGQGLVKLAEFQKQNHTGPIALSYFGSADPSAYGVDYTCLPSLGRLDCPMNRLPQSGWIAISATCLQGLCSPNIEIDSSLHNRQPAAVLAGSMFLYHLP